MTGKIAFYCRALDVTRQGFYNYLVNRDKPWKYEALAAVMMKIATEDEYNDTYGKVRMHEALLLKNPEDVKIPSESTLKHITKQ